jgi:hypothetical protein
MTEAEGVAKELATRSFACPSCGYDLKGNTAGSCPECGRPVTERDLRNADRPSATIVARRLTHASFVAGLVMTLLFSFDAMRWVGNVPRSMFTPPGYRAAIAAVMCGLAMVIAGWRMARRDENATTWLGPLATWVLLIGALVVYGAPR